MPRLAATVLVLSLVLPWNAVLAARLELPDGQSVDLEVLQRQVVGPGCSGRLLGLKEHPFSEAQLSCDAFLSFALVQASLEGKAPPDVRERLKALLTDALGRARTPFRNTGSTQVAGYSLPRSVLYRGFLLLMLAGLERAGFSDEAHRTLFDALAAQTVEAFSKQPLLPSFGESIWPCDNALAASGLLLHGRLRGNEASRAAGERLAAHLVKLLESPGGFPTQVDAKGRILKKTPRGTVLAWSAAFLAMSGHPGASTFANVLLKDFCERVFPGAAACREWPRGVERAADAASGPIIGGYGQGATALAIAATRASEELAGWHTDLRTTAVLGGIQKHVSQPGKYPLETTLYVWASGLRSW
ncbi:hypothetical protein [Archangium lansingense]|uniref:Uncharacterized protein n=1 Tax=Archangium lansingense TaxID=2995310 RepID=A0ABT3ZV40_9BACT|nr:hypothetical protein [Archangium lansinium]MCY1073201.1 hypothetical protein [Archangium lansinium]